MRGGKSHGLSVKESGDKGEEMNEDIDQDYPLQNLSRFILSDER